jgi:hypothetical protein
MGWFQRNHTGRAVRRFESDFVAALSDQLAELRAPQIDENETALTAEGNHSLILLIPHRRLGGVSIVVWLFADRAEVTWAQVAGLDCCHDSLDLGISVAHFRFNSKKPNLEPILASIRDQITEPLILRRFGDERTTVHVRDGRGKLREVGTLGRRAGWREMWRRAVPSQEAVIRLSDADPPPVSAPPGVNDWFGAVGHGG